MIGPYPQHMPWINRCIVLHVYDKNSYTYMFVYIDMSRFLGYKTV